MKSKWNVLQNGMVVCGLATLAMSNAAWAASTDRASVSSAGVEGNAYTDSAAISSDGRYVAFSSGATNLVPNDNNGVDDIFLRDRLLGTTVRINVGAGGVEANAWSANPAISRDGRYIAYESGASNLVSTATNSQYQIFRYDVLAGTTVHDNDNVHQALINAFAHFGYAIDREDANSVMGISKPVAIRRIRSFTNSRSPAHFGFILRVSESGRLTEFLYVAIRRDDQMELTHAFRNGSV